VFWRWKRPRFANSNAQGGTAVKDVNPGTLIAIVKNTKMKRPMASRKALELAFRPAWKSLGRELEAFVANAGKYPWKNWREGAWELIPDRLGFLELGG